MKRRSLLQLGAAGGASLAALLFPGSPQVAAALRSSSAATHAATEATDPNFVTGVAIALEPAGMVVSWGAGQRAVRVSPTTYFWKETVGNFGSVELGDTVYAGGVGRSDGSLDAAKVWLNIGRFDGQVEALVPGGMTIRTPRQHLWDVEFSPHLEVVRPDGSSVPDPSPRVSVGQRVGGVVFRPRDGRRRATRMWYW